MRQGPLRPVRLVGAEATHPLWSMASALPAFAKTTLPTGPGERHAMRLTQASSMVGAEATHPLWGMASALPSIAKTTLPTDLGERLR